MREERFGNRKYATRFVANDSKRRMFRGKFFKVRGVKNGVSLNGSRLILQEELTSVDDIAR